MESNVVTYALPRDPSAWSKTTRSGHVSASRLEGWQRRPFAIDTDRCSFIGLQVFGYHVGVYR